MLDFKAEREKAIEALGLALSLNALPEPKNEFVEIMITRGEKRVAMPCRVPLSEKPGTVELLGAAIFSCQLYEESDDILEWSEIFQLNPGDGETLDEFSAFGVAYRDFQALLGRDVFETLMEAFAIYQAAGKAAGSIRE
ncbi:MAG: hypothetical protein VW802_15095 [Rhodospirillaceae bacterium]|jgi:hypothetical protein